MAAAATAANQAESMYENVISEAPRVAGGASWLPPAYRSLGYLYYAHRDTRGRHCEAKTAFEKYLELAPSAPDRAMIADRLRELSCGTSAPAAKLEPNHAANIQSCASGESWDRASGRCVRNACPSGEYWSSLKQACKRVGE
jgi:hypothetical protein